MPPIVTDVTVTWSVCLLPQVGGRSEPLVIIGVVNFRQTVTG